MSSHPSHLFLCGFRGTGKSSVAEILAGRLGRPRVDLDERIRERTGRTIADIFREGGEPQFRHWEAIVLAEIVREASSVVALGGGTILTPENRQRIRESGVCFWLDADAETLAARIEADAVTATQRPPLTSLPAADEVRVLLARREPHYKDAADHRIDTRGKTLSRIADDILEIVAAGPEAR